VSQFHAELEKHSGICPRDPASPDLLPTVWCSGLVLMAKAACNLTFPLLTGYHRLGIAPDTAAQGVIVNGGPGTRWLLQGGGPGDIGWSRTSTGILRVCIHGGFVLRTDGLVARLVAGEMEGLPPRFTWLASGLCGLISGYPGSTGSTKV